MYPARDRAARERTGDDAGTDDCTGDARSACPGSCHAKSPGRLPLCPQVVARLAATRSACRDTHRCGRKCQRNCHHLTTHSDKAGEHRQRRSRNATSARRNLSLARATPGFFSVTRTRNASDRRARGRRRNLACQRTFSATDSCHNDGRLRLETGCAHSILEERRAIFLGAGAPRNCSGVVLVKRLRPLRDCLTLT
jgi:hypothetical protein